MTSSRQQAGDSLGTVFRERTIDADFAPLRRCVRRNLRNVISPPDQSAYLIKISVGLRSQSRVFRRIGLPILEVVAKYRVLRHRVLRHQLEGMPSTAEFFVRRRTEALVAIFLADLGTAELASNANTRSKRWRGLARNPLNIQRGNNADAVAEVVTRRYLHAAGLIKQIGGLN